MRLDVFIVLELNPDIFESTERYTESLFKIREIAAKYNIGTNFGVNMCGLHKNYAIKFNNFFKNPLFFEIVDNPLSVNANNFFNFSDFPKFKENSKKLQTFICEILDFSSKLVLMINSYEQKDFNKLNPIKIDVNDFAKKLVFFTEKTDSLYPTLTIEVTKGTR